MFRVAVVPAPVSNRAALMAEARAEIVLLVRYSVWCMSRIWPVSIPSGVSGCRQMKRFGWKKWTRITRQRHGWTPCLLGVDVGKIRCYRISKSLRLSFCPVRTLILAIDKGYHRRFRPKRSRLQEANNGWLEPLLWEELVHIYNSSSCSFPRLS